MLDINMVKIDTTRHKVNEKKHKMSEGHKKSYTCQNGYGKQFNQIQ